MENRLVPTVSGMLRHGGPEGFAGCQGSTRPQSRVLIFSALLLTIWSTRVTGTLCIADLLPRVCVRARVSTRARSPVLQNEPNLLTGVTGFVGGAHWILSAFAFSCQPRIFFFLLALLMHRQKQLSLFTSLACSTKGRVLFPLHLNPDIPRPVCAAPDQ